MLPRSWHRPVLLRLHLALGLALALSVALAPQWAAAEPEPNNNQSSAIALPIGLSGVRAATLSSSSDVDWYTFVPSTTGTHTVEVFDTSPALGGTCLTSYTATGAKLASSCVGSGTTVARLEVAAQAGARQWVKVSHTLGRTGSYSVRALPPASRMSWDSTGEPNNSLSTASPLAATRWTIQTLHALPSTMANEGPDVDVHRLPSVAQRRYRFTTTNLSSSLGRKPILKVYDQTGRLLATGDGCSVTAPSCHDLTVTATGTTLYALVTAGYGTTSGTYWLCGREAGKSCSYGPINQFGDLNSDGTPDVLAVHRDGTLQLYATLGPTTSAPLQVGHGWQDFTWVALLPDATGDGCTDLLGRRNDGTLWRYAGNGRSGFGSGVQVGRGWNGYGLMTIMKDITGDGLPELLARQESTGDLYRYSFTGTGFLINRTRIGQNWRGITLTATVDDFSGDGLNDLLAIRDSDGALMRYSLGRAGTFVATTQVGKNWGAMGQLTSPGDINNDRRRDLVSLRKDGALFAYWNAAPGVWGGPAQIGTGVTGVRLLA